MKTNITHHLDPATILAYAAGTLGEALSVAAASHVAWCSECREAVRKAEAVGGEMLAELAPAAVSEDCRSKTMGLLDRATVHRFPAQRAAGEVPAPLARLLGGRSLADLEWKTKAPGVAFHDLPVSNPKSGKLMLMRIAPGKAMPEHSHGGEEITLILSGAYRDALGRFGRGDVADLDADVEHKPVVEEGEACICLVAIEQPTRFKSWPARLLQPFIGI